MKHAETMRYRYRATLFALTLILATPVMADEARHWLQKMLQAMRTLNYSGTFVHIHQGQIESMSIVHRVSEQGEQERLFSLNGEAREVLRDSDQVLCILPANRSVVVGKRNKRSGLPTLMPNDIASLEQYYQIELIGRDRIADNAAVILAIQPRDRFRYGYRLWLEEISGMVLRSDMLDSDGAPLEQMMFTQISLQSPLSAEMVAPRIVHDGFRRLEEGAGHGEYQAITESDWAFEDNPAGFSVVTQMHKQMPNKRHPVEHYVLSDGLASVSVYIEQAQAAGQNLDGVSHIGGVNAFGRAIEGFRITAMGEVPEVTVRRIANGLSRNNDRR